MPGHVENDFGSRVPAALIPNDWMDIVKDWGEILNVAAGTADDDAGPAGGVSLEWRADGQAVPAEKEERIHF